MRVARESSRTLITELLGGTCLPRRRVRTTKARALLLRGTPRRSMASPLPLRVPRVEATPRLSVSVTWKPIRLPPSRRTPRRASDEVGAAGGFIDQDAPLSARKWYARASAPTSRWHLTRTPCTDGCCRTCTLPFAALTAPFRPLFSPCR